MRKLRAKPAFLYVPVWVFDEWSDATRTLTLSTYCQGSNVLMIQLSLFFSPGDLYPSLPHDLAPLLLVERPVAVLVGPREGRPQLLQLGFLLALLLHEGECAAGHREILRARCVGRFTRERRSNAAKESNRTEGEGKESLSLSLCLLQRDLR